MDEALKSLHTPDGQQKAVNLSGMIFQVLQPQDGFPFFLYLSSGCRELYELEPDIIQADFLVLYKLIHPQDVKGFTESLALATFNVSPWRWEGRIITPSDKLKWIQSACEPERQANGDFLWNGLVIDITDRKQTEQQLRESEARYKAILDAVPDLMFRISRDGEYLDLKEEGANVTLSREIVGKNLREVLPFDMAVIGQEAIAKTLASGTLQTCECQLSTPLGVRDYEARLVVSGPDEVVAIVRDITEYKQAEVALKDLAQKFSKAFNCSPDPITISTVQEGRFLEVNDSFVKLTGYEQHEAIGQTSQELNLWIHESDRTRLLQQLQATGSVSNLEFEFRQKSGKIITAVLSAEIIDLNGIPSILAVHHDITERKQAEAHLRLCAQRDRLLTETLGRIRSSLDLEQILQTTVTEVRQFLRADRVLIGLNSAHLGDKIFIESVDPNYPSISSWSIDEVYLRELRTLLESKTVRVVEDITKVALSPRIQAYFQKFHTRANLAVPIMLDNELLGALVAHQCSGPRHWQPMEIDLLQQMSEQVAIAIQQSLIHRELAQLNINLEYQVEERTAQLQQKIQEVEELHRVKDVVLHTVAHDLRTSVMGNLMVLKNMVNQGLGAGDWGTRGQGEKSERRLPPLAQPAAGIRTSEDKENNQYPMPNAPSSIPVSRSIIERMIQGNDRQLTLIDSLLEINSCEKEGIAVKRELIPFSTLIEGIIRDWEPTLTQNQATMENLVPEDLPLVMVDATRLQKVLADLLTNSLQHNPPGLNFTLSASVEAGMIRTQIQDNGVAISKPECDRLFDLYVRDPQDRCSTSIGLKMYLCRKVIKAHGGEIGVMTNHKSGLTFWFTLPLEGICI